MDGTLIPLLHGNLNLLSDKSLSSLCGYYETGTLTLKDHISILNDLIRYKAISLEQKVLVLKSLTQPVEITSLG